MLQLHLMLSLDTLLAVNLRCEIKFQISGFLFALLHWIFDFSCAGTRVRITAVAVAIP